jgi:hypothetical protein
VRALTLFSFGSRILGGEIAGKQGARQTGKPSIAEDGLESDQGVGTRVEGPSAGGVKDEEGIAIRAN